MKRTTMLAVALAAAPVLAAAETPKYQTEIQPGLARTQTTVDAAPGAFDTEREVVAAVESVYGSGAVLSSGGRLPANVEAGIVEGRPLPAGAPVKDLPKKLLDRLPAGHDWKGVGEHIVALAPDGTVETVVYDVLP